jgi:hypothetical protein
LLSYYYENDTDKAKQILHLKSNSFQTNCFEFVKKDFEISTYNVKNKVDNDEYLKKFVSHKCFQEEVKKKCREDSINLSTPKYVGYLIVCLMFFPLLYFPSACFNVRNCLNH